MHLYLNKLKSLFLCDIEVVIIAIRKQNILSNGGNFPNCS